jgi:hypothetical protein
VKKQPFLIRQGDVGLIAVDAIPADAVEQKRDGRLFSQIAKSILGPHAQLGLQCAQKWYRLYQGGNMWAAWDCWDHERDARKWPGGSPCVAHPPCRGWGRMRQFSYADEAEKELAIRAVLCVQLWGGVVEHPAESSLWAEFPLPRPGQAPRRGAYTIEVDQWLWGHRAEKRTWLYILGCKPDNLPLIPEREGKPTHCVRPTKAYPRLPSITKAEREQTPPAFAEWLVELARRCA